MLVGFFLRMGGGPLPSVFGSGGALLGREDGGGGPVCRVMLLVLYCTLSIHEERNGGEKSGTTHICRLFLWPGPGTRTGRLLGFGVYWLMSLSRFRWYYQILENKLIG